MDTQKRAMDNLNRAIAALQKDEIEEGKRWMISAQSSLQAVHDIAKDAIDQHPNTISMIMSSMHYQVSFTTGHIETISKCLAVLPDCKDHVIAVLKGDKKFTK